MPHDAIEPTTRPELKGKNAAQLHELKADIDRRLADIRETEGPKLLERFETEAKRLGMDLRELVLSKNRECGRPWRQEDNAEIETASRR